MKRCFAIHPSALLALALVLASAGCKDAPPAASSSAAPQAAPAAQATASPAAADGGKVHKLASGLVYEDLVVGDGKMADPGLTVTVHYTGWLTDGTKFDSSLDRGRPYPFVLGQHEVIAGWDEGVKGMRVGGRRKLTIPADLAYGAEGRAPVIPPNATLIFEVQLLGVN